MGRESFPHSADGSRRTIRLNTEQVDPFVEIAVAQPGEPLTLPIFELYRGKAVAAACYKHLSDDPLSCRLDKAGSRVIVDRPPASGVLDVVLTVKRNGAETDKIAQEIQMTPDQTVAVSASAAH